MFKIEAASKFCHNRDVERALLHFRANLAFTDFSFGFDFHFPDF